MPSGLIEEKSFQRMADATRRIEGIPRDSTAGARHPGKNNRPDVATAKVTAAGAGGAGYYKATEQRWNGTAFEDKPGGRIWDDTDGNLQEIVELNLKADVAVNTIVNVTGYGDNAGATVWLFNNTAGAAGYDGPFKLSINVADNTKVDVGAERGNIDYAFNDLIVLGVRTQTETTIETITIGTTTGLHTIYYEFTGTTPDPILKVEIGGFPQQTATIMRVMLGTATVAGSVVASVAQTQFGAIMFPARFFFET